MRCMEVLLTAVFDPTRIDPYFAAIARSLAVARCMLRKNMP